MIAVAKVAARVLVGAAAGAALLLADATVEPASAQEACKDEYVSATGRGKWRPFSREKELEGNGAAKRDAIAAWERKVADSLGASWKQWEFSKSQSEECGLTQGKVFSKLVQCTVKARPCPAPEKGAPESAATADRDDNRRPRYAGTSWRYRIEMRHQERLTEWRSRRQDWAWRREENRQRYLQVRRDRIEQRERERADARERYYARWR